MKMKVKLFLVFFTLSSATSFACLWDRDTLLEERQQFPSALELITGKFLRHSKEFYQWRVEDRENRLKTESTPELYDDLAVAYEKLGNQDKAIEVILKKQKLFPGLYETHANLGTFYIHKGDFENGLKEIDKAIKINPDAHFGREVYQKLLVEYLIAIRNKESDFSKANKSRKPNSIEFNTGFAYFLVYKKQDSQSKKKENRLSGEEVKKAVKGILGMMRFGNYKSPVLLEALGNLFMAHHFQSNARRLAARAYLKASYETKDPLKKKKLRAMASGSLSMQTVSKTTEDELSLERLEKTFKIELLGAETWYKNVVADEKKWIEQGGDVDAAFTEKYYSNPKSNSKVYHEFIVPIPFIPIGVGVALLVVILIVLKAARRKS